MMRILHTSDWHLGRTIHGRKRTAEFEAFLGWLLSVLEEKRVDVLLVAGDVFDTTTPSHRTQQLYYRFLCRVAGSGCRHAVIVGGNHDSPSFLDAPRELLSFLDVHIVGAVSDSFGFPRKLEDELVTLCAPDGSPELLVCAVPFLRDRDIRFFEENESFEEKEKKLTAGIERHYREIARLAGEKRAAFGKKRGAKGVPVAAMGHLFAAGGETAEEDGVRDLYIGSLAHVDAKCFSDGFDYVALGHLHMPQKVNGSETVRYSGSPLPMGPGEKGEKSVVLVEFDDGNPRAAARVETLTVPVFQKMERVSGDAEAIERRLRELCGQGEKIWLEIVHEGDRLVPNLRDRVAEQTAGTNVEVLCVKDPRRRDIPGRWRTDERLEELDETDVFLRCLEVGRISSEERPGLIETYREVLLSLQTDDPNG